MNNPFALFDLPVAFQVDAALLNERYLALQKSLHPDNFSAASAQEQRLAIQKSAEINDALRILKDPIARADSIIDINTGETENVEEKSTNDIAFLMQQMEWRETLETIEQQKNADELTVFSQDIQQTRSAILTELSTALNEQQWQTARTITDKLRFIKKLQAEIERVEENLFDL
ncbi:Fe-S protein assembly co-chaperone HscB [Aggregatibacter actinomycetemcomitans serotype e str. SC1083]|uniref:Co-chaperone protein HscB homolog n=1 Tax=Aggregatibacter actinomycetemcomitans serotype e str. SC1083 TaxID=907488 RepID=G4A5T2_AGGAC|nr:Fe-S protein assembly co-chaperone HscB [Aggregatibacter actinomycetemcomitans]EGY35167.1 Fe-S protein assembly co-chaperone HscB [Aggregatibacter actinomycetemcomitans serotype e str. SC1083]KYK73080.1 CoA-transferase [Aggregatibacter actinomycetemcomitans serotype e str. SA3096]KYK80424.1 CoA-transferase [Aggregatibacter actinomycetemcomitans serotype e str. SC936]KYK96568.1 CoA-transferase [Aggregatibacter actinomycetemcomitans serotype e str. ANH9776]TYB21546.1 Fe-S protein assembly co-